ncbi:sarcosine oxidase subunit delta [Cribrihabitans pelagius]|uniref:sarcosine oxidase subunit delta n=1 Tax=Cribrihabitans pelagius TaxID=1765746 RepID=UPI003B599D27
MRISCPHCGERDRREFTVKGAAALRPPDGAGLDAWHGYLHLRENPAGRLEELWYHEMGCGAWLVVTRDTVSHAVLAVRLAADAGLGGAA